MKATANGSCPLHPEHQGRTEIKDALQHHIDATSSELTDDDPDRSFFVADLGEIYRCYNKWKLWLPRIKPFYAVKSNPDQTTVNLLHKLGLGFDCASKTELQHILSLGTSPDRIVYAHPCKSPAYIKFARSAGVSMVTFDNADELYKLQTYYPEAELVLRIAANDPLSSASMGDKFGAELSSVRGLLELAQSLSLHVVGISFHIGSGAMDPGAFRQAVEDSRRVFETAREYGYSLRVLDVGGGFTAENFEVMAKALDEALKVHFPPEEGVEIIAEPGRFFVSSAYTLACKVIARKVVDARRIKLYINDGVYSNFMYTLAHEDISTPKILRTRGQLWYGTACMDAQTELREEQVTHAIWGRTCDGADHLSRDLISSLAVDVGDWLYFEGMGAYSLCCRNRFNGFPDSQDVTFVSSEAEATRILKG